MFDEAETVPRTRVEASRSIRIRSDAAKHLRDTGRRARNFDEAIRHEKIYLESQPGETFTLFGIVRDLSSVGRFEEAQAYVTRLEATDPAWAFAAKADMLAP